MAADIRWRWQQSWPDGRGGGRAADSGQQATEGEMGEMCEENMGYAQQTSWIVESQGRQARVAAVKQWARSAMPWTAGGCETQGVGGAAWEGRNEVSGLPLGLPARSR